MPTSNAGLARELISELESLVRQHPLNERLAGHLMLALYRSSRQADALRAYRLLKSRLGDELGIEPSAWIRQLESKIVTGDEPLETAGAALGPAGQRRSWPGGSWIRAARAAHYRRGRERLSGLSARRRS